MTPTQFWRGAVIAAVSALGAAAPTLASTSVWHFRALLDGQPIGDHRFTVTVEGDTRQVLSEAQFTVRFLGLTAYRYQHQAREQWRGDCLSALRASTDDDGKASLVQAEARGDQLALTGGATAAVQGCVMSFAYWNPALQTQTRLLNVQTGRLEDVRIGPWIAGTVEVRGQPVAARKLRISGPKSPIDVWYSLQGEWLGLDSTVAGGRRLSYRLQ